MNTKELRIGNFVEVGGEIQTVDAICSEKENHIQIRTPQNELKDVLISDVKPIPLHEELLGKCCDFDEDGHHKIGIDHHRHYLKIEDGYIVLLNADREPMIQFWDIKSLHQLQNLYYALKGKEMEVILD